MEPVSREHRRAETPGLKWDETEVEWVGYEAVEEGVEIRGRYTADAGAQTSSLRLAGRVRISHP